MSEAQSKIIRFEHHVMWRSRLLSLLDRLAVATALSGIIAAGLVIMIRVRVSNVPVWAVITGVFGLSLAAASARWFFQRVHEQDAAFLIDKLLGLEDRAATAHSIIDRGGPKNTLEETQLEDTAERTSNQAVSSMMPVRLRKWHTLAPASVIVLAMALMIPQRVLPIAEELAAERTDINTAADHLERTAEEVEQIVPRGTETASLANEQAELGRGLRRSTTTRSEALKRLSGLEERIRNRHDDLASTHADEIVAFADRRLGSALSTLSTAQRNSAQPDKDRLVDSTDVADAAAAREPKENRAVLPSEKQVLSSASENKNSASEPAADRANPREERSSTEKSAEIAKKREGAAAQDRPQEPVSSKDTKATESVGTSQASKAGAASGKNAGNQNSEAPTPGSEAQPEQKRAEGAKDGQQPGAQLPNVSAALNSTPDSLLNQAAKALPKLSEDLMKKATQLRANELSPADIEKLRQAAESLSRELAQIAQSKELQQALQEMARQVRPEQIEQVARELGNHEKLKQELESAARLLMENHQAKQMIAGIAGEFARAGDQAKKQNKAGQMENGGSHSGDEHTGKKDGAQPIRPDKTEKPDIAPDQGLAGQGRESSLRGNLRPGVRGEYLYLQSKAGAGAVRTPYSSAYPQYRREAERSVQRTQVPPNLRSVVRKYFDAINPDSKR